MRPLVALGVGLKNAGHRVRIATDQSCRNLVVDHGLEFSPLDGDFVSWMRSDKGLQRQGLATRAMIAAFRHRLLQLCQDWPEQGMRAVEGADLLIGNGMVFFLAAALGETLGIPVVESQLVPTMPSQHSPVIPLPRWMQSLPPAANVALGHMIRQMIWHVYRPAYNMVVRPRLGLKPYPWFGPYYHRRFRHPKLLGYSACLVEPHKSWPSTIQTTGPWILEGGVDWQPPADLVSFLEAGPAPVYIGFGSMYHHDAAAFTAMIHQAIEDTGKRVILAAGWGGLNTQQRADNRIFNVGHLPHDWLLPRVALAVHHGGAGTTHAAIRAGIPSVVVPVFGDQPFWAGRLQRLGVAPPALPRETLTAADLTKAMTMADSPSMRARAATVGQRLRAEHGVDNAIKALREFGVLPMG
ncbi:UDP:flavonoid glycosyltransferase YjiC (YdhE family) [Agrobacterium vitis]|nr:UDP:flavonoid glycosyltransferase YjiC (YdhE family) [Agrobacterium vitis]MBE1440292.1 UDP:flavonoid glycosyltransferase YjiC (YdhE family) [Agrobacterium vitis]